jgi:uncharacterized membrane protein
VPPSTVHPEPYGGLDHVTPQVALGSPRRVIRLERHGGVLAGVDIDGLVGLDRRHGCVLRLVRNVGDFVVDVARWSRSTTVVTT